MWIFCSGAVGKGKLFWFFSVGFVCRQKPNVLDRALAFYTDAQRVAAWRGFFCVASAAEKILPNCLL